MNSDSLKNSNDFIIIDGKTLGIEVNDTILDLNQVYIPAFKNSYKSVFTGNIGTASFSEVISTIYKKQIEHGINHFDDYKLHPSKRKIYLKRRPFTRLEYLLGGKKEQFLKVKHQQHVTNNMLIGLDFISLASEGYYNRQITKQRSFDIYYLFNTKNKFYYLLASYTANKNESQENGGIVNDTLFENDEGQSVDRAEMNLLNAKSLSKDKRYYLKQSIYLNKPLNNLKGESLNNKKINLKVSNVTDYLRKQFVYEDTSPNLTFYNSIFYDSTNTYDSSFVSSFLNILNIGMSKKLNNKSGLDVDIFSSYQNLKYFQNIFDTTFSAIDIGARFQVKNASVYSINFEGKYGVSDEVSGAYEINGDIDYNISEKYSIGVSFVNSRRISPIVYRIFDSNHFNWKNNFSRERNTGINFKLKYKDIIGICYKYQRFDNHLYFDTLAIAKQLGKSINTSIFELSHRFNYKKIRYHGTTGYSISSDEEFYPVPEIKLFHSLFFEDQWFKVGLPIQIGFDFRFHSNFYAKTYMPVNGQRYLQKDIKIGDYLFTDFFFNFRIKNSNVFFKIDHFHEGLIYKKRNYFIMPHHPMAGRSFKIGIKWKFFD